MWVTLVGINSSLMNLISTGKINSRKVAMPCNWISLVIDVSFIIIDVSNGEERGRWLNAG